MPIRALDQDEERVFQYHDFKIYYRPLPRSVMRRFVHAATRRGQTDWEQVADQALEYSIIRWEGLVDRNGNEVPYSPENLDRVPPAVLNEFTEELLNDVPFEAELKNSKPSSAKA